MSNDKLNLEELIETIYNDDFSDELTDDVFDEEHFWRNMGSVDGIDWRDSDELYYD